MGQLTYFLTSLSRESINDDKVKTNELEESIRHSLSSKLVGMDNDSSKQNA